MFKEKARSLWNRAQHTASTRLPGTTATGVPASAAGTTAPTAPKSTLFECPDCGHVYIATEKDNCRECKASVTEIRQTVLAQ